MGLMGLYKDNEEAIKVNAAIPDFSLHRGVLERLIQKNVSAKGLSYLLVTKEMTAEEFKEEEHPRDSDGKFRDKYGPSKSSGLGSASASEEQGAWGGARKNAGRTPKDPVIAKQKLEEKLRQESPNITDEELKQRMLDWSVEKKNPDLYLYLSDPVAFQKKREQELVEVMATKRGSTVVANKKITKADSSEVTDVVHNEIKTTKAEWEKEISQARDVREAWRVFRGEHSDEMDQNRAKLTMAAATIALAVGLGVMYAKRPKFAGFRYTPGAGRGPSPIGPGGTSDPLAIDPQWTRLVNLIDPKITKAGRLVQETEPQQVARRAEGNFYPKEVGALSRIIANVNKKITGKRQTRIFGEKILGMTHERYNIKKYEYLSTKHPNYVPKAGDMDPITGATLVGGGPDKVKWDTIGLAIANKRMKLYPRKGTEKLYPPGLMRGNNGGWEYRQVVTRIGKDGKEIKESGEKVFADWLARDITDTKGRIRHRAVIRTIDPTQESASAFSIGSEKYEVPKSSVPENIIREREGWGKPGGPKEAFESVAEQNRGWSDFFNKKVIGPLSVRILAMLTVTAGGAGAAETVYYFQKDIERFLSSMFRQQEAEEGAAQKAQSATKQSNKDEITKIKAEEKRAKAQTTRAKSQLYLELARENVINELVRLGAREEKEGARTAKSLTEDTIRKYLTTEVLRGNGYAATAQGYADLSGDLRTDNPKAKMVLGNILDKILEDERKKEKKAGNDSTQEEFQFAAQEERDESKRRGGGYSTQGATLADLIEKAFGVEETLAPEETNEIDGDLDDHIILWAEELASMISDISQSCKLVVESGMPGNSGYAALNDIVTEIYAYMKDQVKNPAKEISQKGIENVMSSQSDSGGGLFVAGKVCQKCKKIMAPDQVTKCKVANCPNQFTESIVEKR